MKNKNTGLKIMVVLALILSVAGLSLGFANYTSNLKIESEAKYKLNLGEEQTPWLVSFVGDTLSSGVNDTGGTFDLSSSSSSSKISIKEVTSGSSSPICTDEYTQVDSTLSGYDNSCNDVEATDATLNGLNASGIEVTFKNLAAGVAYQLPIGNYGLVDAYLKSITFDGTPICTAAEGATISNDALNAICNNIEITYMSDAGSYSRTTTNISANNKLEVGKGMHSVLFIGLKSSEAGLSNIPSGEINISIPDITLGFNSVN